MKQTDKNNKHRVSEDKVNKQLLCSTPTPKDTTLRKKLDEVIKMLHEVRHLLEEK